VAERGAQNGLLKIDGKYGMLPGGSGRIKKLSGQDVPDDEPLIVFRAQDGMSLPMLEAYARLCREAGCLPAFMAPLYRRMADFAEWQAANPGSVKVPD
jgi:hypothetical protein